MKNISNKNYDLFSYLQGAKAIIIITSNLKGSVLHKSFYKADIKIAGTYGAFAAKSLGLSYCWLGLCEIAMNKSKKLLENIGIMNGERVDGVIGFGYSDLEWKRVPPRGPVKSIWL